MTIVIGMAYIKDTYKYLNLLFEVPALKQHLRLFIRIFYDAFASFIKPTTHFFSPELLTLSLFLEYDGTVWLVFPKLTVRSEF